MGMTAMTLYSGGCAGNQKQSEEVRAKPYKIHGKAARIIMPILHPAGDRHYDTMLFRIVVWLACYFFCFLSYSFFVFLLAALPASHR